MLQFWECRKCIENYSRITEHSRHSRTYKNKTRTDTKSCLEIEFYTNDENEDYGSINLIEFSGREESPMIENGMRYLWGM